MFRLCPAPRRSWFFDRNKCTASIRKNGMLFYLFLEIHLYYTMFGQIWQYSLLGIYSGLFCADMLFPFSRVVIGFVQRFISNAYHLVGILVLPLARRRDGLENRRKRFCCAIARVCIKSDPFVTDYTQIHEDVLQNLDFAYKAEGRLRPCSAFYTQLEDSPPFKSCICV